MSACICPEHHQKDKDGYPRVKYDSRTYRLNRLQWKLCFGEVPKDRVVAHKCNNKGCINPEHLYLTTSQENSTDAARDGLYLKGEDHPKTKWKDAEILHMLKLYNEGNTQQTIADLYGISQSRVCECIKRATKLEETAINE